MDIVFQNGKEVTKTKSKQADLEKLVTAGKATRSTVTQNKGELVTVTYSTPEVPKKKAAKKAATKGTKK